MAENDLLAFPLISVRTHMVVERTFTGIALTSLMTNYVLLKMEASRMGVFVNLGTVVTIIAGVLFLKEEFYYYHVIGSILVIGGVLGANYFKRPS